MKPSTPRLGRGPLLKAAVLGLGLLLAAGYFGCGRTPPPGFWEPSAEDSTAIAAAVEANRALFELAINEADLFHADTVLPGTTRTRLNTEVETNRFMQRFRWDAFQHVFFTDSYDLEFDFTAVIDTLMEVNGTDTTWMQETTATVTVVESIPGVFRIHAWSYTKYLKDSLIPVGGGAFDTLEFYSDSFSPIDFTIEKSLVGNMTTGAVFKKTNGSWELWKLSGGSRWWSPSFEDAPYLAQIEVGGLDTAHTITLRPDTLQYGIQRFYGMDDEPDDEVVHNLPTFKVGDSLSVSSLLTTVLDCANYIHFNGERHEFRASDKVALTEPGIFHLYVEQIPIEVLYEVDGQRLELNPTTSGGFSSTAWGVAIRVVEE